MLPSSLQKNIRELDRQISLLETECDHMETEKRETPSDLVSPKVTSKKSPDRPFITGPCASASLYSSRMVLLSPVIPKIYSASCAHFRTTNENHSKAIDQKGNQTNGFEPLEKNKSTGIFCDEGMRDKTKLEIEQETNPCKRSIGSIKEVSESSEDNALLGAKKRSSQETPKEQTWSQLLKESNPSGKRPSSTKNLRPEQGSAELPQLQPKLSSDEETDKVRRLDEATNCAVTENVVGELERPGTPRKRFSTKRKPRSARTKINSDEEIPLDVNITKALQEKEIQCMLWSEERDKIQFLANLNESIRTLHVLIAELKMKSSKGRRNDFLNDMQKTLMKINKTDSTNIPVDLLTSLKRSTLKLLEGDQNILDLKKTLLGVKKCCQDLMDEKSALSEEVSAKNRIIATFKNKEKEYLSLISSLKFNLEKMKEKVEEGAHVKKDVKMLKAKLQEERKVIEALQKSHDKMQELIEKYVLENDKLRAQVKITKLESHKFNVLLDGKEVEISKYKKEIESFQRQITEQLSLLRSKATENHVEHSIEVLNTQKNALQVEVNSKFSDTTPGKDHSENFTFESTETTSESSSTRTQPDTETTEIPSTDGEPKKGNGSPKEEPRTVDAYCKANNSGGETNSRKHYGLQRVLSSSKNLRSSINELLEDIRRENSEKQWYSLTNSCNSSSQSVLSSTSDEEISEISQKD